MNQKYGLDVVNTKIGKYLIKNVNILVLFCTFFAMHIFLLIGKNKCAPIQNKNKSMLYCLIDIQQYHNSRTSHNSGVLGGHV
jgi:hypothetical protein